MKRSSPFYRDLNKIFGSHCKVEPNHFWIKIFNSLRANLTKWSNILKQFVGCQSTNCLSVFDHFMGLTLKGLREYLRPSDEDFFSKMGNEFYYLCFW